MRTASLLTLMTVLSMGCSTPAQRAAEKASEATQMLQIYGPACERLGFVINTDPWRSCMIQMHQTDVLRYSYDYVYPYGTRFGPYF